MRDQSPDPRRPAPDNLIVGLGRRLVSTPLPFDGVRLNGRMEHAAEASVVVTCFNQGETVREAVDSALAQTRLPAEIIVVDDGSTDDATLRLFGTLEDRGSSTRPVVRVIRQANAGPSAARNAGIRAAHTPYVAVLDGDDLLMPDFLARTMAVLDIDDQVVAASGWLRTFGVLEAEVRSDGGGLTDFLSRNRCPATCLIRRSAWERCGGYEESMRSGFEDWDFFLSLLECGLERGTEHGPTRESEHGSECGTERKPGTSDVDGETPIGNGSTSAVDRADLAHIVVVPEPLVSYRTAPSSSNVASMERRLDLMRIIIDRHRASYVEHAVEAILGVEATSIARLAMWEDAVHACPEVLRSSPLSAGFMVHPTYGDGGMAAAVRIRSAVGRH